MRRNEFEQPQEQCDELLCEMRKQTRRTRWWCVLMSSGCMLYSVGLVLSMIPVQILAIWIFIAALLWFTD